MPGSRTDGGSYTSEERCGDQQAVSRGLLKPLPCINEDAFEHYLYNCENFKWLNVKFLMPKIYTVFP